jgi:hypothetical protein
MVSSEFDNQAQGDAISHANDHKRIIIRSKARGGDKSPGDSYHEMAT